MEYSYIDSDEKLAEFRKKNLNQKNITTISMDFEGEFNLHCYGESLCLIQVFDGYDFYAIDPFAVSKPALVRVLESGLVKLFYSAGSDRKLAFKQYGIKIKSIFDLSLLVDVLNLPKKSLDAVLFELLGIEVEKKKKYQMHNWTLRPIVEDAIQYALSDVKYLFQLKDALMVRIIESDLVESMAYELATDEFNYEKKPIPGVKKKGRYSGMSRSAKATFDSIFDIREMSAKAMNKPPNSVLSNEQLHLIAENKLALENVNFGKGVSHAAQAALVSNIRVSMQSGKLEKK